MLWIGTQSSIEAASAVCDEAVCRLPEVRGNGSLVPESERVTRYWDTPKACPHCSLWYIIAPVYLGVAVPGDVQVITSDDFAAGHPQQPASG